MRIHLPRGVCNAYEIFHAIRAVYKGVRYASPNCDRCYGSRNSLLAPDFTVDFCSAKIAAATNLVSLRETGSLSPLPAP